MASTKVSVVTGTGTPGIGLAMVRQLAKEEGAIVYACCRKETADLLELEKTSAGAVRVISGLDVGLDESGPKLAARLAADGIKAVDLLVNMAGVLVEHVMDGSPEWCKDAMLEYNVNAVSEESGPLAYHTCTGIR